MYFTWKSLLFNIFIFFFSQLHYHFNRNLWSLPYSGFRVKQNIVSLITYNSIIIYSFRFYLSRRFVTLWFSNAILLFLNRIKTVETKKYISTFNVPIIIYKYIIKSNVLLNTHTHTHMSHKQFFMRCLLKTLFISMLQLCR